MKKLILLIVVTFLFTFSTHRSRAQNLGGNDFWFTFPLNFANGQVGSPGQNQLVIVSGCTVKGTIQFPALGTPATNFTVTPGVATIVDVSANNNTVPEVVQNNGIHIMCDNLVSVYAIDYLPYTVDGETLLPTSQLGMDYVLMGYSDGGTNLPSQFTVVATQNTTKVTITTTSPTTQNVALDSHAAGSTWSVTLNAGQTYRVDASAYSSYTTFTGTHVKADKPIAVVTHTPCTNYICVSCDMIMAEMLPTALWGTKYITAQAQARLVTPGTTLADYLEIVAGAAGAKVTIRNHTGAMAPITLGPYQSTIFANPPDPTKPSDPGEANTVITSDKPIQVSQYSQGVACDNSSNTDPEHIMIYPENMWIADYTFSCSTTLTTVTAGITIVVDGTSSGTSGFTIDGGAIPSTGWTQIGSSTYKYRRVAVPPGPHHITNTNGTPFGFYQYATGSDESYIIQGGATFTDCTVPIELLSFVGKYAGGKNVLSWSTATEKNNDHFLIERSVNGEVWAVISDKIKGAGNSSTTVSYSFTDNQPGKGINFYRLKQVDFDGKFKYANPIAINTEPPAKQLEIAEVKPVPALDNLSVSFNSLSAGNASVDVYDLMGRRLFHHELEVKEGENNYVMDLLPLHKGIYFMEILKDGERVKTKIVRN